MLARRPLKPERVSGTASERERERDDSRDYEGVETRDVNDRKEGEEEEDLSSRIGGRLFAKETINQSKTEREREGGGRVTCSSFSLFQVSLMPRLRPFLSRTDTHSHTPFAHHSRRDGDSG